ncbi:MAG: serine acetyltransferase [Lachnospiraceae bacterium]|nr:serine acetyltransferase [Lachnospiraceae bacterium]
MEEKTITRLVETVLADYEKNRDIDRLDLFSQPDREQVLDIMRKLLIIVFPGYYRDSVYRSFSDRNRISVLIEDVMFNLRKQVRIALSFDEENAGNSEAEQEEKAEALCVSFFERLPQVRALLATDVEATYEGDPAARDVAEVILSYPGLYATCINRLAHELYLLGVPVIPRMMTEYAHGATGIDIHPGATIGKFFMIDHGTGVVIGETAQIGEHVKIYQGVTIGALSTRGGQKLRGEKRHPTIEDHVTIYAGASILGGETVIGHDAVIGSNVFITSSVKPGTRVSVSTQELEYKNDSEASFKS